MATTEIPAQQAQQLLGQQGGVSEISREEALRQLQFSEEKAAPEIPPSERPGLISRIVQRAFGTDVEDPLELERLGTVMTGAIGGSVAGSRTPIAPGPAGILVNPVTGAAMGGLAGVIAGAVAPEATLEAGEFVGVLSPGTRDRLGLSDEGLRRVVEGEALLEIATMGAATGFRMAGRLIGKKVSGIGPAQQSLAREASEAGIELAPFQLGNRGLGRGIINVVGRFPFIGSKARSISEAADASIQMMSEGAPSRIANILSSSKVGENLWRDANATMKRVGKEFGTRYDDVMLRAGELGVPYRMDNTRESARGVLISLAERQPETVSGTTSGAAASESVKGFLKNEGYDQLVNQSLAQADELILKIDQHIAETPRDIRRSVIKLLSPVRGALKADIATNGIGDEAKQIAEELATIDADFSATMGHLFETSAAQKFASVQKGGLKTAVVPSKRVTRLPVDKLTKTLADIDSPQVMDELSRLVSPQTYKEMAALKIAEQFDRAIKTTGGTTKFNADVFGKSFGITGGASTSGRRDGVKTMLDRAGEGLAYNDLETIAKAASVLADSPVPNWSTFVARRAMLGGAGSMMRGVLPIAALTGGAAAGGGAGALLGGLAFLVGGKGIVGAVSNPLNARAIKEVISEETTAVVKRAAFLNLARASINVLQNAGEMSIETANQLIDDAQEMSAELFPQEETD